MKQRAAKQGLLLLAVASLAGCGGGSGGAPAEEESEVIPTFTVMFDYNVDAKGMSLTDNEYIDYLQEQTGVRVELDSPGTAGYLDKLNILMASGNYPDAFGITDKNKLLQFANDDLLTDIAPYLDNYPNLKNAMPEEAWLPVTQEGKIWAIPYNRHDGFHQVVYINKTWLDTLELEIPRTIDEFYEVMKAFTEQDPDRNGKKDTFGLLGNSDLSYGGRIFLAAFDAEAYRFRDGELQPPEITEEYRSYLTFMNRLISENILDPEWPTITGAIFREKVNTLKYGMFNGFWHFQSGREFAPGVMDHYVAIDPPLMEDGSPSRFTFNTTNRHYIAIPSGTENIEALLTFFDWAASPEGTKYNFLGIENKHYTENNGVFEKTDTERAALHWAFSLIKHGQYTDEIRNYMRTEYSEEVINNLTLSNETGQLDTIAASLPYYPELAAYNLPNIVQEYQAKTILGNENVETSWNDFVAKYRASGGDKAIKLWTDWYEKEGAGQ